MRREWRIMVDSAYYSVPHQHIGKRVEVCVTHSLVRIFYESKEIALHERATKKWEYKRKSEHAPPFQEAVLQCTREGLLTLAQDIGLFTYKVSHTILSHPSVDKLRPIRHLLRLAKKYSNERLEMACQRAFECKLFSYGSVKNILENGLDSQPIEAPDTNKIIPMSSFRFARDPADYKSADKCPKAETFEEKLERLHPSSRHGNGMMGAYAGLQADQMIEEERRQRHEK